MHISKPVSIIIEGIKTQLKRQGQEYIALCPFHKEKTPSFTVSSDLRYYHCFGCGGEGELKVSREDQRKIAEALLNPPEPTLALRKAAKRYGK